MILQIIDTLANTSSTLEKLEILQKNSGNHILKNTFRLAYDPKIKFWIKKRPPISQETSNVKINRFGDALRSKTTEKISLVYALEEIERKVSFRLYTGNNAIKFISDLLYELEPDDQEIIYRILERDLKCGVNIKLINKVWRNLVSQYPIMLCSKFDSKTEKNINIEKGVFFQKKEDGGRINLEFEYGKFISATTRNGNLLDLSCFNDYTINIQERVILDGELLYAPGGVISDRKIGNGIITKAIRNTIQPEESADLIFVCWDCIPYADFLKEICTIPYKERFEMVQQAIPSDSKVYKIVQTEKVFSKYEMIEKYKRNISLGYEGGILKTFDSIWEPKRSKYNLKLKAEDTFDAVITKLLVGTGKNVNRLGAFEIQSSDGIVISNVGTGFTDEQRIEFFNTDMIGKIVSVKYNQLIQDKDGGWSLFLPVFDCIRYDKDVANSFDEIKGEGQ